MSRLVPERAFVEGSYVPGYQSRAAQAMGYLFTGVWLLYLVAPVVNLITGHYSEPYRWGGVTIIAVFSAVYLIVVPHWPHPARYALPGLAALAALAVLACLLYGGAGASTFWIFVSSASGLLVVNRRWATYAVLTSGACYAIFCLTGHVDREDFLINLLPTVLIGLGMIGLRRQFQLTAELATAREEVAQLAASEERLRLARDLHDLTGQSLSMITLKSELAAKLLRRLPGGADRDRALAEALQVAEVGRQTLHDIREAISGYRRPTLAVETITARTALESAGITPHDDAELTLLSGTVDPAAEAALAWCLREAATNVIRHSGARNCHVSLARRAGGLCLEVRDDGAGAEGGAGAGAGPDCSGTGLRGMSERLSALGGHLEVRPSGRGFHLIASVPVKTAAGDGVDRSDRSDRSDRRGATVAK